MRCGALRLVLRLSRALAAAPYVGAGRGSRALAACGWALTAALNAWLAANTLLVVSSHSGPWLAVHVLQNSLVAALVLAGSLAVCSAPGRVRRIFKTLTQLDEITTTLPSRHRKKCDDKKEIFFIVVYLICQATMIVMIVPHADRLALAVILLLHCTIDAAALQTMLTAAAVGRTLQAVNDTLQEHLPDDCQQNDSAMFVSHVIPREAWPERGAVHHLTAGAVRRLAATHAAAAAAVRAAAADGPCTAAVVGVLVANLACFIYQIILWGLLSHTHAIVPYVPILQCVIYLTGLVSMVEPFHETHSQLQRTRVLVLGLQSREPEPRAARELQLFARALLLSPARYCPLGLCALERAMVVKTVSCIVTYLLITLTFAPDLNALAHLE